MIEFIFTIDYEIFGNGKGSLEELIYGPAKQLKAIFDKWNTRFVVFVEVAELEMIEANETDEAIDLVKHQVREFFGTGYEIGLHLHPQWYNARYENGKWFLDYSEYNLCIQPRERIIQIVDRSIGYLRRLLGAPDFTPLSFRAGNWLIQPTRTMAQVLYERGLKVDSSVFKGGRQHQHNLDFRPALKNGYFWPFADDVNVASPQGRLVEFPIYSTMVPIWKLLTTKRIGLQQKAPTNAPSAPKKRFRLLDFLHFLYPLKLDFCRMTMEELKQMLDAEIRKDREDPTTFRPIVAIGHTKDLFDFETVEAFLGYLQKNGIRISDFRDVSRKVQGLSPMSYQ